MNAYELANELQEFYDDFDGSFGYLENAIDMLRQQANKIAELEKKLQESAMNCISAYAQADDHYAKVKELEKFNKAILKKGGYPYEKSNPVAWMSPDGKVSTTEGMLFHIPLYTTPQTKPLSDEEIKQVWHDFQGTLIDFARAIEAKIRGKK